jgi:hypothetical protein
LFEWNFEYDWKLTIPARGMDAGFDQAIKTVGADELKALVACVRGSVALDDFGRVA